MRAWLRPATAAALVCAVVSVIVTHWIGSVTTYDRANEAKRLTLHRAILANAPPEGRTWMAAGANGMNIRVLTVWSADRIHEISGLALASVYRAIDLACLFATLLLVWAVLLRWFPPDQALLGTLLLGCLLPLTMFFGYFHPWDRPAFLLWAALLALALAGRLLLFLPAYVLAIVVKFDAITAVALPFALAIGKGGRWVPAIVQAVLIGLCGLATFAVLLWLFPGGQEPRPLGWQFRENLASIRALGLNYPPLLSHGLLLVLGLLGWRKGSDELRRLWVCGLALLLPHLPFTYVVEVRAQVATTLCMLPLALAGLSGAVRAAPGAGGQRAGTA
jgi:hypothetical protein